jgi:hypothetical protein
MKYFRGLFLVIFAIVLGASVANSTDKPDGKNKKPKFEERINLLQNSQIEEEKQISDFSKKLDYQNKNLLELVKQAKDEPKWTDVRGVWISGIAAFFTLVVVFLALFQEKIRSSYNEAFLDMAIDKTPPGAVMVQMTTPDGGIVAQTLWLRIKVHHKESQKRFFAGKTTGEKVEIIPLKVSKQAEDGTFSQIKELLPISLRWSNYPTNTPIDKNTSRVPFGFFRYCDLGFFSRNPDDTGSAIFEVETLLKPNPSGAGKAHPNILVPGKYKFELLMSGDNVHPLNKAWTLEFEKWHDDEAKMIDSITIEP